MDSKSHIFLLWLAHPIWKQLQEELRQQKKIIVSKVGVIENNLKN